MYEFFYDLAVYANENWKGNFTPKEIACNAYTYLCDCQASTYDNLKGSMNDLYDNLYQDVNDANYEAFCFMQQLREYLEKGR